MCGITGFFTTTEEYFHNDIIITRMTSALNHRGPDDAGFWTDPASGISLGHRRLSIIDLSSAGHQPMLSFCNRYVCVYNGEIYNFLELREELEKFDVPVWRGHSDTEVMLAGFSVWGVSATIAKLNGMFACAVYDRREQALTLFRDRMGKKPLYYGFQGSTFLFGSELKALRRHPAFEGIVDRNALALFLRYNHVPEPYSIYQGIRKLPHASSLIVKRHDLSLRVLPQPIIYWDQKMIVLGGKSRPPVVINDALDSLEKLLADSVKRRMISDVPLGVFLSGGIDSSLVTAIMQKESQRPIKTFTIGFHEAAFNEAESAARIARCLGTEHTELYCTPADTLSVIPQLPAIFDEPFADSSQIPTYLVSRLAKSRVTVALSGDGGDEVFGGYDRYRKAQALYGKLKLMPRALRRFLSRTFSVLSCPLAFLNSIFLDRLLKLTEIMDFQGAVSFYKNTFLSHWKSPARVVIGAKEDDLLSGDKSVLSSGLSFLEKMMYLDTSHYLPDDILVKVDRASMAVSLETRAPLLDYRVFEYAWSLPLSLKIKKRQGKWVLRELLARYLPRELFERPKKGFSVPIASWLRGPLYEWAEELLNSNRLSREGFFNVKAIREKWNDHVRGGRNFGYYLWDVLMFQAWLHDNKN